MECVFDLTKTGFREKKRNQNNDDKLLWYKIPSHKNVNEKFDFYISLFFSFIWLYAKLTVEFN